MREFTTTRRPIKDWICCSERDKEYEGKPITIDLDSVFIDACGARSWFIVRDGLGIVVCEHVIYMGD